MEDKVKVKNTKIAEIFSAMDYGENLEKTNKAIDWLKTKGNSLSTYVEKSSEAPVGISAKLQNSVTGEILCEIHIPEIDTIKNILVKSNEKNKWIDVDAFERTRILNKLASEIDKNSDLFAQIECVTRGILIRDTKNKAVSLLGNYFRFYSVLGFTFKEGNSKWKPPGIAVGVISNGNPLSHLGLFLAPALAAGYNIVLQVGTKIAPAAFLIQDLARSVG
ncbi:hypothetical protein JTB14_035370 [Gonioctena quinquepunctata]|nr:hypothetical protein JTB14_035370 [Gonioctena quinquepunctata]